jgi:hypothetical protein
MIKFKSVISGLSPFLKLIIVLSLICLVISFFLPAFYIDRQDRDAWADGKMLFFLGWMSVLGGNGFASLVWLANPLYIASIVLTIKGKKAGLFLALLSSLVAASFSFVGTIITDEAGHYSKITSLEPGYILWLTSILILTIGTGLNLYFKKSAGQTTPT